MSIPVLVLTFNRPKFLKKRLDEILERDQYTNVIVSVDFHSEEMMASYQVLLEAYIRKFPDKLSVVYRDKNIGIARHLPTCLDEIFKNYESAIIFEDDIVVGPGAISSFVKANQMLKIDESIFTIGGFSFSFWPLARVYRNKWRKTYYFSAWGWMTGRNQWSHYRQSLSGENLANLFTNTDKGNQLSDDQKRIWLNRFEKCQKNENRTWDIPLQYWTFVTGKHHLLPNFRILENEGFDALESTNTRNSRPRWMFKTRFTEGVIEPEFKNNALEKIMRFIDSLTIGGDRDFSNYGKPIILLNQAKRLYKWKKY